jgi:hypothetical protein
MSRSQWVVRSARKTRKDRALLESFACADTTVTWQAEVESFIRTHLFDWAFDPLAAAQDPRLLLVLVRSTGELIGVAAHERVTLTGRARVRIAATKLEVVAVARTWQGRRFPMGERVSDVVMSAAMTDIAVRVPPRDARVLAVVHEDNVRSIALCQRHGLVAEMSRPTELSHYRRLVTAHQR